MSVYKHKKEQKQIIESVKVIENKIETLNNKINNTEKQIHKLTNRKRNIYKSRMIGLKNNLNVLNDSKTELVNRLNNKNKELNNINQRIRDIRRFGEINLFDFYIIPQDNDVEYDLKKFLDLAENNVVLFENDSIFDVVKNDVRYKQPFILKGEIKKCQ